MTATTDQAKPLDLLGALPLEDGTLWGTAAQPWQIEDAQALLEPGDGPRRYYLLRGRGMSKTTDVAGVALVLLLSEAPAGSTSFVYAADEDQALLLMEALAGFIVRAGLSGRLRLAARSVTSTTNGATLTVETSDGASALGKRPYFQIVDEFAAWPNKANHRQLWSAIVSAQPKVPGSRLIVITTAGSPVGMGAKVWAEAQGSPHWYASKAAGPSPWWSAQDVVATRASLTPAEWRRLIECEWAEGDDALTSPQDVEAAIRPGNYVLPARAGITYTAALDIGTRRDLSALVVGHAERRASGRVYVVDRLMYWKPSDGHNGRVDLSEVEATTLRLCREYGARLRFDRSQAEQLTTNLEREGVRTEEFIFSAAGVNRLARGLWNALRDRTLEMPDDDELREQFLATRLVEVGPSGVKLNNPTGAHDDIPTVIGMLVADLSEQPDYGPGVITRPGGRVARSLTSITTRHRSMTQPPAPDVRTLRRVARQNPQVPLSALVPPSDGSRYRR